MAKLVQLKCGHSVNPKIGFKAIKSDKGNWLLEGFEPDCGRTVRIRIDALAPTMPTLEKWNREGIAKTLDGCTTEPDGDCQHGYPSWLRALGFI